MRGALDGVLDQLRDEAETLRLHSFAPANIPELKKLIGDTQQRIVRLYVRLNAALEKLDESASVDGHDWRACVTASWEAFTVDIDRAYGDRDEAFIRSVPTTSAPLIGRMINTVETKLNAEMNRYVS